jgi:hypothetical protein
MKKAIREISRQRSHMRNEMFPAMTAEIKAKIMVSNRDLSSEPERLTDSGFGFAEM